MPIIQICCWFQKWKHPHGRIQPFILYWSWWHLKDNLLNATGKRTKDATWNQSDVHFLKAACISVKKHDLFSSTRYHLLCLHYVKNYKEAESKLYSSCVINTLNALSNIIPEGVQTRDTEHEVLRSTSCGSWPQPIYILPENNWSYFLTTNTFFGQHEFIALSGDVLVLIEALLRRFLIFHLSEADLGQPLLMINKSIA